MQIKKLIFISIVLLFVVSTTSCYDSTEIDDLIYVLSIGINEISNNQTEYTFQVAVPLNISSGVETSFAESEESVTIQNICIVSNNIFSALELANAKYAKKFNVSHCKLILFSETSSENMLKENILNINNYDEFQPNLLVVMCKNPPTDYIAEISSPFEKNPARYYEMFFQKNFTVRFFNTKINEFEKNDIVALPLLNNNEEMQVVILKNYQKIEILSSEESLALNVLTGKLKEGYISIPNTDYTVYVSKFDMPKINMETAEKSPQININLKFQGNVLSQIIDSEKTINEIEKYINQICNNLLYKSSKILKEDITGIIKYSKPNFITTKAFKEYNWDEKYPTATFNVCTYFEVTN